MTLWLQLQSLSYNGHQGHLATITSAAENDFITTVA